LPGPGPLPMLRAQASMRLPSLRYGLYLDGSNVALINSRVHKINQWTQRSDGSLMEACALNIGKGPGPGKIDNNLLEAIGITVFFPDNLAHAAPQADYEIRRNHFSRPDKYLYGSPANTSGKNYMNRYMLELKAGQRMVVEGNLFDGNWADSDHGAMIVLTPRSTTYLPPKTLTSVENGIVKVSSPQDPYLPGMLVLIGETGSANHNGLWEIAEVLDPTTFKLKNPPTGKGTGGRVIAASCNMQISDIDIRNNIFRRGPNVMVLSGHHETGGAPLTTKTTQRIRLANNLVYGMDARAAVDGGRVSPIGGYADGRPGVFLYLGFGMEDLIIRNNTIIDYRGLAPTFMAFDSITVGAHAGLEALYNIFTASPAYLIRFGVLYFGVEILNLEWTRHPDPWWVMSTNVFCCELPQAMETRKPPGNAYLDSETRLGLDVNFCLRLDSPLKGLIAGRDPGIDYDELYAALPDALRAEFPIYSPRRRAAQAERPQPRGSR